MNPMKPMKPITLLLVAVIRAYQLVVSPWLPPSCRFEPSCSHYAVDAMRAHGPLFGLGLSVWRILRCNPFGTPGFDPVPAAPLLRWPRR